MFDETFQRLSWIVFLHDTCINKNARANAKIMDALRHCLKSRDREDDNNVDEEIKIDDNESELDLEKAQTREYSHQDSVICSTV